MRIVFVADVADRDAGLLADHLHRSGATSRYIDRERLTDHAVDADVMVLLGSNRSAHELVHRDLVQTEISVIRRTLEAGTPVMGICYGAQLLARALGGDSGLGPAPECGWTWVDSVDEDLCPAGLWGQMHRDVIIPAPSSTVIGHSPVGVQSFIDESFGTRAIGWQFHPELTIPTFRRWLSQKYSGAEGSDSAHVLRDAIVHETASRARAEHLFSHAFAYLRAPSSIRRPPPTETICIVGYD